MNARVLILCPFMILLAGVCASSALGQARRSYSIDSLLDGHSNESSNGEAKMRPIESWLENYVPAKCRGVQRVEFHRTTERSYTSQSANEASRTVMEVIGRRDEFSDSVTALLEGLGAQSDRAITVDVHIVQGRAASSQAQKPATVEWLAKADFENALRKLKDDSVRECLSAPRITVLQAMEAQVDTGTPHSYIKDWTLFESGGSQIAEPEIDVLHEGIRMRLVPILHPDGSTMTLSMSVTIADLVRPIPKVLVDLGIRTVQREVPELRTVQWDSGMLDIPEDVRCFRVLGLRRVDANTGVAHEVELLVHVEAGESAMSGNAGRVIAVDAESRTVVVETADRHAAMRPGARYQVLRSDAPIATIVVDRAEGALVVARVVDGELPAAGDSVR